PRQHSRRLCCAPSPQAGQSQRAAANHHRAQRRLSDRMSALGLRARLQLAVAAAVAAALVGLIAGFNLILGNVLDRDARDLARARAQAQVESLRISGGRVSVGEAPDDRSADAYVWIFDRGNVLERPRTGPAIDRAARTIAGGNERFVDVPENDTRLYA